LKRRRSRVSGPPREKRIPEQVKREKKKDDDRSFGEGFPLPTKGEK